MKSVYINPEIRFEFITQEDLLCYSYEADVFGDGDVIYFDDMINYEYKE